MEIQNLSLGLILSGVECMEMKLHRAHLGYKQRAVLDDMLKNGLTEHESLEKHNVSPCRYRKWLENGLFEQEINARIDAATRQSRLVMARYLPWAAERLIQLTASEKDETARKACLDVFSLHNDDAAKDIAEAPQPRKKFHPQLTPEIASKMLAMLAEEKRKARSNKNICETCPPQAESALICG